MMCACSLHLWAQNDTIPTIKVGRFSTTHVLFMSDLTYVDLAMSSYIAARVVESSKNMLALNVKKPFDFPTTISALEANGTMHTFKVMYEEYPKSLLIDTRQGNVSVGSGKMNTQIRPGENVKNSIDSLSVATGSVSGLEVTSSATSNFSRIDAPTLEEAMRLPQRIYHIGDRNYGIMAYCSNIFVYSDLTYIVLNVVNKTDIGYEAGEAQFTIENVNSNRKSLATDKSVWPKSSYGSLSCPPRGMTQVGYTIPKVTLMKGECLKIYIYEKSGNRNLILTLTDKDLNYATSPMSNKSK